jgi:molecular chaperone DnaJ
VRDPYDVLGVSRDASPEAIKTAFRKLAAKHHPDRNPGDSQSADTFKEINAAYQLLSDPDKRVIYDRFGEAGVGAASSAGPNPFGGGVSFDLGDFANIGFDGVFGDLLGAFGFAKGDRGDLKKQISVSFEEAAFGCEKEVSYERMEVCSECRGSGGAPGSSHSVCSACSGRGKVRFQQGILPLAVDRACSRCRGTGRVVTVSCETCNGEGLARKQRTILVQIPPGVDNGATHLVSRGGNAVRPGKSPGDLELEIKVDAHPFFRRVGDDILCSVPVTFPQATLGSEVEVPTLDGKGKLRVPAGTQSGTVLRIRGKGIPRRVVGGRGDQLVEIAVEVPQQLSDRARELVEELSKEMGTELLPQRRTFLEKLRDLFG